MGDDSFGRGFGVPRWPCREGSRVLGPGRARHFVDTDPDWMRAALVPSTAIWSFAIWVKTSDVSQSLVGIYKAATTDGVHELLMSASGNVRQWIEQDNGLGTNQDHGVGEVLTAIDDGEWHCVCGSVNATTMSVWVDGVPGSYDPPGAPPTNANPMTHGRTLPNPTHISLGYRYLAPPWNGFAYLGDQDECSWWDGYYLTDADAIALNTLGRDNTKRYYDGDAGEFGDATVQAPTAHWSLSETLNPTNVGKDEVGSIDLTDNGTTDVEGIPAGD